MWVPIGFEKSFRMAYSRTHYGTGYYIYKKYANDEKLSQSIQSWDIHKTPDKDIMQLINKAGSDIAPKNIEIKTGSLELDSNRLLLAEIKSAPSVVRAFKLTLPLNEATDLERLRLQVTWDEASQPSIDAPLSLFFGAGTLYNRDQREYLVKGFPMNIRFDDEKNRVELACYYPMPFFESARFEITGINPGTTEIGYEIRYEPYDVPIEYSSYFHATYRNIPNPEQGKDLVLLDTKGVEGKNEWSGSFVGTSIIFSHNAFLGTLEGDPRFFFDGSKTPQAYGTGTEEWNGGGDYWGGENMTLPFAEHPTGAPGREEAENEKDLIQSAYRFLLADLMPFGNRAEIHLEHGGWNLSKEHYETVTYWYGLPAPSLIKTDEIDIGKKQSEEYHEYESPEASEVLEIVSRYEWGIDTYPPPPWGIDPEQIPDYKKYIGSEIYPAHKEDGRYLRGTSEFTVNLSSDNLGVLLRRTLDYSFPNQRAQVHVADVSSDSSLKDMDWKYAGNWYLAGSNTNVYSYPEGELGDREYQAQTSNRRFRDDEFLIPAKLTQGSSTIRVRISFIPTEQELYPGKPFPRKSAWSELRYEVFSYVKPRL